MFTAAAGGGWTPAAGRNADLVQNPNGTWKVTYRPNGEVTFTSGGYLTTDADLNGNDARGRSLAPLNLQRASPSGCPAARTSPPPSPADSASTPPAWRSTAA